MKARKWTAAMAIMMAQSLMFTVPAMAEEASTEETAVEAAETGTTPKEERTRVIISQDGEVDDMNSLVHTLLYANDLDIAGIVQSSSQFHWIGDEENEPYRWPGTDWMYEFLNAYAEVYDNLKVHDPNYPTPDELRAVTVVGNIKAEGEMEEVTEGSELIRSCIMDDDERTLYIAVGGGANTVGRALKSIEEEYAGTDQWDAIYEKVCNKVVINAWGQQDNVYETYISVVWPDIKVMNVSGVSGAYGYGHANQDMPQTAHMKMQGMWMYEHIDNGHGPLLSKYVTWGDGTFLNGEEPGSQFGTSEEMVGTTNWWGGDFMKLAYNRYDFLSEGDSPDWIQLIPTGLRSLEDESYGGWGGRYERTTFKDNEAAVYYDEAAEGGTMNQWVDAIQSEFAARADWCITPNYEDANHAPSVEVTEGIDLTAAAGETVTLHAVTSDPDGDEVNVSWRQYAEADTYEEKAVEGESDGSVVVTVSETDPMEASFTVPEDAAAGDTIHIILEAKDNGNEHNLVDYQRIIVTVA